MDELQRKQKVIRWQRWLATVVTIFGLMVSFSVWLVHETEHRTLQNAHQRIEEGFISRHVAFELQRVSDLVLEVATKNKGKDALGDTELHSVLKRLQEAEPAVMAMYLQRGREIDWISRDPELEDVDVIGMKAIAPEQVLYANTDKGIRVSRVMTSDKKLPHLLIQLKGRQVPAAQETDIFLVWSPVVAVERFLNHADLESYGFAINFGEEWYLSGISRDSLHAASGTEAEIWPNFTIRVVFSDTQKIRILATEMEWSSLLLFILGLLTSLGAGALTYTLLEAWRSHREVAYLNATLEARAVDDTRELQSQRVRLAEASQKAQVLAEVVRQSPVMMAYLDGNHNVQYVNPAMRKKFGISLAQDVTKMSLSFFHDPIELERLRTVITSEVLDKGVWRGNLRFLDPSGGYLDMDTTINAIFAGEADRQAKKPTSICGIFLDRSKERELELQLRQSQKMESIGQLTARIAHDFNNKLGAITLACDASLRHLQDPERAQSDLKLAVTACGAAEKLVRQLLAFGRKQSMDVQDLELEPWLREEADMLSRLLGEQITLDFSCSPEVWGVRVDETQLEQVLMNLGLNSRDAMAGVGKVKLEINPVKVSATDNCPYFNAGELDPGDYVEFCFSDTGCGIPEEYLQKIFEPFFSTKRVDQGTGLGLAMVYGIVKQSGGALRVDSHLGKGTTFTFLLPKADPVAEQLETKQAVSTARNSVSNLTLLLVEDEEMFREIAAETLEAEGFKVYAAASPEMALELWQQHKSEIDLVVTDVIMPGMNGKDMVAKFRRENPELRAIFMSGYTSDIIDEADLDFDGFVKKPFAMDKLLESIDERMRAGKSVSAS